MPPESDAAAGAGTGRSPGRHRHGTNQVIHHVASVVLDAVQERRPAAQDRQAQGIQTGDTGHAAVVAQPASVVQDRLVQPGVVGPALWTQFGVVNQEGAEIAEAGGLSVIMDRCLKVEHARYSGRMNWLGFNTQRITAVRSGLQ